MEEHTRAEIEEGGAEAEDTTIAESAAQIDVEAAAVDTTRKSGRPCRVVVLSYDGAPVTFPLHPRTGTPGSGATQ